MTRGVSTTGTGNLIDERPLVCLGGHDNPHAGGWGLFTAWPNTSMCRASVLRQESAKQAKKLEHDSAVSGLWKGEMHGAAECASWCRERRAAWREKGSSEDATAGGPAARVFLFLFLSFSGRATSAALERDDRPGNRVMCIEGSLTGRFLPPGYRRRGQSSPVWRQILETAQTPVSRRSSIRGRLTRATASLIPEIRRPPGFLFLLVCLYQPQTRRGMSTWDVCRVAVCSRPPWPFRCWYP